MHDPMHVALTVRLPIPDLTRPRKKSMRGFLIWCFRDKTWRGTDDGEEHRVPLRRRAFVSSYMLRGFKREWPLPSLLTVWHVDPESDGSDSSCRNALRARRQAAIKRGNFLTAAALDWQMRHYGLLHAHHWKIQFDLAQRWRRRLLTRCATCGGREERRRAVNFHVVVDREAEQRRREERKTWRGRWLTGEVNLHHHDCADLASLRATKAGLASWTAQWGHDEITMRIQREREPYYGCYPWWREAILGEDPDTAATLAAAHVQRSAHPCGDCDGKGKVIRQDGRRFLICTSCEGTGHPRVEKPIPAELV